MLYPLKGKKTLIPPSGEFGAPRANGKRAHAGVDLYATENTPVYAMKDCYIRHLAPFYEGTNAIEAVCGPKIIRYCEIKTSVKKGDFIPAGDMIGMVSHLNMLHLEMYTTSATIGLLTNRKSSNDDYSYVGCAPYFRSKYLLDPTSFLKFAKEH